MKADSTHAPRSLFGLPRLRHAVGVLSAAKGPSFSGPLSVYEIEEPRPLPWRVTLERLLDEFRGRFDRDPVVLDWLTGFDLAAVFADLVVFSPADNDSILPYLDRSIDLVVSSPRSHVASEARRVAAAAVVTLASPGDAQHATQQSTAVVEWVPGVFATSPPLPTTTIIIPVHGSLRHTQACLHALQRTLPGYLDIEILVLDDASGDGTERFLAQWAAKEPRLRVERNPRNLGFIESCNRAAQLAQGDMLVFLNNDTVPFPNWLPPLLHVFRRFPDAGAVGGKVLSSTGILQEAGGVIFADGSAAHVGRGDVDDDHPVYAYVREVDYCSGALLAIPRRLFLEMGGFDPRYRPAYYEDVDLCFTLRAHDFCVYYQPASRIVHRESVSHCSVGVDTSQQLQLANRAKFGVKWQAVLETYPSPHEWTVTEPWEWLRLTSGHRGRVPTAL